MNYRVRTSFRYTVIDLVLAQEPLMTWSDRQEHMMLIICTITMQHYGCEVTATDNMDRNKF